MNNKKLLSILLNDLNNLEDIIGDQNKTEFTALELEFLRSRMKGMKGMLEILENQIDLPAEKKENLPASSPATNKTTSEKKEDITENKPEPKKEPVIENKSESHKITPEKVETKAVEITPVSEPATVVSEQTPTDQPSNSLIATSETVSTTEEVPTEKKKQVAEKSQAPPAGQKHQRLGESFTKEKSVNDAVNLDNTKLEHKLSNRPVSSIQSAIGINDRFQYIRELFDGDADAFSKTVKELDSKADIGDATKYIRENFNWEKNETSLKFVQLVKRRFLSDAN